MDGCSVNLCCRRLHTYRATDQVILIQSQNDSDATSHEKRRGDEDEEWEKCQPRLRCKDADIKRRQKDNDQRDCPE